MDTERETEERKRPNRVMMIVYYQDESQVLRPVFINRIASRDRISQAIFDERGRTQSKILELREKRRRPKKTDRHGNPLSSRRLKDIKSDLTTQIHRLSDVEAALDGRIFQPIELIRKGSKIIGCRIGRCSEDLYDWWRFVRGNQGLIDLLESKSADYHTAKRVFLLQYRRRQGSPSERNRTFKELRDFVDEKFGDDEVLPDYIQDITRFFDKS